MPDERDRRDSAFDIGRLLRKATTLDEKVVTLEHKLTALEIDQRKQNEALQKQNETLQTIMAEQALQGQVLKDVAEAAREWKLIKPLKARIGIVVWAIALAIPGYGVAFGVQYATFSGVVDDVSKLKRDADSDDEDSPAAKEKKWRGDMTEAVNSLTREVRVVSETQTKRIDDINSRTRDVEKALTKRRILRVP